MNEPYGNTPTGTYSAILYNKSSNTYSYGPYRRILLTGISGIAKSSGRSEIMIHGGNPETDTSLARYPLRYTHGCIRVSNSDHKGLNDLISTLINNFDAERTGRVTVTQN